MWERSPQRAGPIPQRGDLRSGSSGDGPSADPRQSGYIKPPPASRLRGAGVQSTRGRSLGRRDADAGRYGASQKQERAARPDPSLKTWSPVWPRWPWAGNSPCTLLASKGGVKCRGPARGRGHPAALRAPACVPGQGLVKGRPEGQRAKPGVLGKPPVKRQEGSEGTEITVLGAGEQGSRPRRPPPGAWKAGHVRAEAESAAGVQRLVSEAEKSSNSGAKT